MKNNQNIKNSCSKKHDSLAKIYDKAFYEGQSNTSYMSAKKIIYIFFKIYPNINSVLDVGCGVGTWLKVWLDNVPNIVIKGVDCNELPNESLYVDRKNIDIVNLEKINVEYGKFDLVESLEVGEHLSEEASDQYVKYLCSSSDLILFSAALPKQTGDHHINEQYPEYWNKKFRAEGFECFDILRQIIWNDNDISWWYRQNIMIYARGKANNYLKNKGYISSRVVNTYYHPELVKMHLGV